MKKRILLSLILMVTATIFHACTKKAGPLACASSTVSYSEDLTEFLNNQTKSNCERVVKSIKDVYSSCTALSALDKDAYKEVEDDLDCSSFN